MVVQEYLKTSQIVSTHSLEEAREAVERVYLDHDLVGLSDALDMRLNAISNTRMTLGYLTYQAETVLTMPPTEDCYHVNLTLTGSTFAERTDGKREKTEAQRSAIVLSPMQQNTVHWTSDAGQLILKIPRISLDAHLSELIAAPVRELVEFDFGIDLSHGAGHGLLRAVEFLATEIDRPDGLAVAPLAREQLESYVITALLHAGTHQYSELLRNENGTKQRGRLAAVLRYIDEHLADPLTTTGLARIANVSERTLQAQFREEFGQPPMGYVRQLRLARARHELLMSDPLDTTVNDVALRWGFFHQSRFAAQYRREFRELPSETLAR